MENDDILAETETIVGEIKAQVAEGESDDDDGEGSEEEEDDEDPEGGEEEDDTDDSEVSEDVDDGQEEVAEPVAHGLEQYGLIKDLTERAELNGRCVLLRPRGLATGFERVLCDVIQLEQLRVSLKPSNLTIIQKKEAAGNIRFEIIDWWCARKRRTCAFALKQYMVLPRPK